MDKVFEKQIALVTGGSTGIGAAVALQLAQAGARVVITGRHEATLRTSAARHPGIEYVVADVGKSADVTRTIEEVRKRHGRLDVLINNAGIMEIVPLSDAGPEHVRRTLDTNLVGLIETTRLALPLLRAAKGTIVNVTTTIADQPFGNMSVYCASKAAVLALTRAWAQELAADGIRVNAMSPGPIETPLFSPEKLGISGEALGKLAESVLGMLPLKRFGKPEEVAQVITFLASPASSYVTGAQYTAGGGFEA
jgi:NAD(P)-dependent dehydrogenase (short-subunit alcohol dehydrogenase family)